MKMRKCRMCGEPFIPETLGQALCDDCQDSEGLAIGGLVVVGVGVGLMAWVVAVVFAL